MLFSVILPIYKVEQYLPECLDSILGQSFKDYEIILVDDGSPDKSPKICDQYASKDERIRVIHKKNEGASSARNAGTEIATGNYILYIDSDDFVIGIDFLQKLADHAKGTDIIFYKHQKYGDESNKLYDCNYSFSMVNPEDSLSTKLRKMVEADAFYGMPWNKCIRREFITDNNICFEEGLLGEDMDWIYRIITKAKTIELIDKSYIAYRQRKNSITSSVKLKNLTDFIYILEKWHKEIQTMNLPEEEKLALYGSLAKYYSNLLITYTRVRDSKKKQYVKRIKQLSVLLKYSLSNRPRQVAKIYRNFGFGITVLALGLLDRVK